MLPSFYNSIIVKWTSYRPLYPNVFPSLWERALRQRLRASEQARALSYIEKEQRSQLKAAGAAPSWPSLLPILRLNAPHTCLQLILSCSFFSLNTLLHLQSAVFSPLSPSHLTLTSLSFPLIPNHWHQDPALCHHPLHPHPTSFSPSALCSFLSCSAFKAPLGPHHWLCSYNGSVVLRWSKTSLICSNWGERSVCLKWKVWVIGYLGGEDAISLLSST